MIISNLPNPQTLIPFGKRLELDQDEPGLLGATEVLKPEFESELSGLVPEKLQTFQQICQVIADVEKRSQEVDAFEGVAGKDIEPGRDVKSPEGSLVDYALTRNMLNWSGVPRVEFHYYQEGVEDREFQRIEQDDNTYDAYASKTASAPLTLVIFDAAEKSFSLLNESDIARAKEESTESGLLL